MADQENTVQILREQATQQSAELAEAIASTSLQQSEKSALAASEERTQLLEEEVEELKKQLGGTDQLEEIWSRTQENVRRVLDQTANQRPENWDAMTSSLFLTNILPDDLTQYSSLLNGVLGLDEAELTKNLGSTARFALGVSPSVPRQAHNVMLAISKNVL